MWNWIKKHHIALILGIGGLVFFCLFSYLNFIAPLRFNSPDETANFFFIEKFATTNELWHFEPLNLFVNDILHPRSTQAHDGFLLPGGFLGIIVIYGLIAKIITPDNVIYLTPLFAVLAGWAWFGILNKFFNKWVAFAGLFLVWVNPAWWYYSMRGLLPNVLFVSLAIIAAYFVLVHPFYCERRKRELAKNIIFDNLDWIVGGIFLGLSLAVRPSEVFWLALVGIILLAFNFKKINWPGLAMFLVIAAIAFSPIFIFNNSLYGGPFSTGYRSITNQLENPGTDEAPAEVVETAPPEPAAALNPYLEKITILAAPFGLHPRAAWQNFIDYYVKFNWWYAIFIALGLAMVIVSAFQKKLSRSFLQYLIIYGVVSAWLVAVYGSWEFTDNINVGKITIGNSYLRYWLPSFVLATPLVGCFIYKIGKLFKYRALQIFWGIAIAAIFAPLGFWAVFFGEDEGILHVRNNLMRYEYISEKVIELTEENAVIITERSDKIFFPDRRVAYPLMNDTVLGFLPTVSLNAPVYYYNVSFEEDILLELNESVFKPIGFKLIPVVGFDNETLYKFYIFDENNS